MKELTGLEVGQNYEIYIDGGQQECTVVQKEVDTDGVLVMVSEGVIGIV